MPQFGDAFDELADFDHYEETGMVLGGLAASVVLKNGIDSRFEEVPDEVYGIAVAAGAYSMDWDMAAVGGLSHTGIKLAERVGFKSSIEQAGA